MALPDSGNPADYTPDQIEELLAADKTALTKNQKAALARYKFQKAKAEQTEAGGLQPAGVPAPAAPQAPAPQATPPPAEVKAAAKAEAKGPSKEELRLQEAREKAKAVPYAAELRARFAERVEDLLMLTDKPCLVVRPGAVPDVCAAARELGFESLALLTAADYPPDRIEMVYSLHDLGNHRHLMVKARLAREAPKVPSLSHLWAGAVWLEREVWDMFGVVFDGLDDHRRLLLPDTWEGFPLRKDYDSTREQYIAMDETGDDTVSYEEGKGW